ncbi:DUF5687 family protein [Aquimarina hainanensis]|uniref:DUF5687 family protein n=1 Tax=Aquimarina hainanensis TaxID=1578017 RepID=A0ABW5N479_9FLAO|nr:DUF5687 family protein [Aquimarina sp. TRL1]QKX04727.1 hypothetical protein HN014_07310 [Aquimarina sp. TRL1]
MIKHFVTLQRKSFWRAASLSSSLWMKVFMGFWAFYLMFMMVAGSIGGFFYIKEEMGLDPFELVNQFLIYWVVIDLVFRYALQKMPVVNIKPLLLLPFSKKKIASFALGKTGFSFFNYIHAFFFIPFSVLLISHGYNPLGVLLWNIGLIAVIYHNNFLNILLNNKDWLVVLVGGVMATLGGLQYYGYFDITQYSSPFFKGMYTHILWVLIPVILMLISIYFSFIMYRKNLYLDAGLSEKSEQAKTENLDWLDRFGKTAVFLKNDIKLIKRNKRARSTVIVSILFLFYGLLFFTDSVDAYEGPVWKIFAGIFVSGGFLLSFGQFVPSWDSSYYPLMMSQNIRYKEYLSSKWWLMVCATLIATVLSVPYIYFGWEAYVAILVGAIYNMGVNSHVVLWAGAYVKTPIDLTSNKNPFGDKQAFNMKTMLLALPKMALPMIFYAIGHYAHSPSAGYGLVAVTGIIGFAFRNKVFDIIEKIYRTEKYKTLWAYKQKK